MKNILFLFVLLIFIIGCSCRIAEYFDVDEIYQVIKIEKLDNREI